MKTIGRIILLVVGIILMVTGVLSIIDDWNALMAIGGWTDLASYPEKVQYLVSMIVSGLDVLFGLVAVLAGIKGKAGIWLTIFSIIMIAGVISFFITSSNAGTLGDWKNILRIVVGFALPICYFLGSIFVRFKSK